MTHDDDQEALAAEYVLGTLDADERAQAQTLIGIDKSFADVVRRWERRLGELHLMVDAVDPPADTWERIKAGIAPQGEGSEVAPEEIKAYVAPAPVVPSADGNVVDLTRRFTRWRGAAVGMGALAASLAALLVAVEVAPERLPAPLRPPSRGIETVAGGRFVAVLQRDAASPAFLLTIDVDQRSMTVRRVDARREPGKSYELWLVSNQFPQPRSLGVVDNEFTTSRALAAYDPNTISDATYAVTLEPEGGSPTGFATGPVLWAGKLVEAAPPGTTRSP
jgi:anti-sigma-K factor RskA